MTALIGYTAAFERVRRAAAMERAAHAYLITGPRGVGRRTFAVEIARMLNCEHPDPNVRPCAACRACRMIERGSHPDVSIVRRAPDRKFILLKPPQPPSPAREFHDNVEFIQFNAQLRPTMGRKRVYLILNAEDLFPDAGSRLLKTIEEPTRFVHFLLTAGDRGGVLPTIASRCQEISLGPVSRTELRAALVDRGLADSPTAAQLAALAGGSPGWALAAARDTRLVDQRLGHAAGLVAILAAPRLERLLAARQLGERWSSQPDMVRATLRSWLVWWRDVLFVQLGLRDQLAHVESDTAAALEDIARQVAPADARAAQGRVVQTLIDLEANVNARLALDLLVLKLPLVAQPVRGSQG